MKLPFKFIIIFCVTMGVLFSCSPASRAQNNTFYGAGALHSGTKTGVEDTAFGFDSLYRNTTGGSNTAIGANSLYSNTTGGGNTATGVNALYANSTGAANTASGQGALSSNTVGSDNTAMGLQALHFNLSGPGNTAMGYQSLYSCTTDGQNTAIGYETLYKNQVPSPVGLSSNVACGYQVLYSNTSGYFNVGEGSQALYYNLSGYQNVGNGFQTLFANTTGYQNVANGCNALRNNTTGYDNVADGYRALYNNGTGSFNVALGYAASSDNTDGGANVAIGDYALFANKDGGDNVALGDRALESNETGIGNTAAGANAMIDCTGQYNTCIGIDAGSALTTGNFNIDIGDYGQVGNTFYIDDLASDTGVIRIGEIETQKTTYIAGIYVAGVSGAPVYINPSGQLGLQTSSRRFKQDIKTMGDASNALLSLKPVTFEYKPEIDKTGTPQFGLIAEEVEKICPSLVIHDKQGKPYTVRYDAVNAMLLNEFLKEHKRVEEQGKDLATQEESNMKLQATVEEQAKRFKAQDLTISRQQQEIETLTASLKEQASLLQKVSTQMQGMRSEPQVVSNNN